MTELKPKKRLSQCSHKELVDIIRTLQDWDIFLHSAIGDETYTNLVAAWCKDKLRRDSPEIFKSLYPGEDLGNNS